MSEENQQQPRKTTMIRAFEKTRKLLRLAAAELDTTMIDALHIAVSELLSRLRDEESSK